MQGHAHRELVGGGEQHGARAGRPDGVGAARVEGQRDGAQSGGGQQVAVHVEAVRLDGDGVHAARPQHGGEQGQAVREPAEDHQAFGVGAHTAGPGEVAGQSGPSSGRPRGSP
ncbi:hypothetical protein STENM36S_07647 [Streptomyces tendae]